MILVLCGTQDKEFKRLLINLEKYNQNKKEKIIVQAGHTKYRSKYLEIYDFFDKNKLDNLYNQANVIITHGGVGSIMQAIKNNKPTIVCPRLKKYQEHTNDHQLQIVNEFSKRGFIIPYYEDDDIEKLLQKAKTFKSKKFISNNEEFRKKLIMEIDKF